MSAFSHDCIDYSFDEDVLQLFSYRFIEHMLVSEFYSMVSRGCDNLIH